MRSCFSLSKIVERVVRHPDEFSLFLNLIEAQLGQKEAEQFKEAYAAATDRKIDIGFHRRLRDEVLSDRRFQK